MMKLAVVVATVVTVASAAPSLPYTRAADVFVPAALANNEREMCDPSGYTCAQCTECCVVEFTTSLAGCAILGDPQQPLFDVYKPNQGCRNLLVGMHAARIKDCTGYFEGCILWSGLDCTGVQDTLYNDGANCRAPFLVKSLFCYGVFPPELDASGTR